MRSDRAKFHKRMHKYFLYQYPIICLGGPPPSPAPMFRSGDVLLKVRTSRLHMGGKKIKDNQGARDRPYCRAPAAQLGLIPVINNKRRRNLFIRSSGRMILLRLGSVLIVIQAIPAGP